MDRSFEPLTDAEARWVHEQLDRAREFARDFESCADHGQLMGLESLDRAFGNYLTSGGKQRDANAVVLALGVAFGVRLVEDLGFQWVIASDDYGMDLAVLARPGRGDVAVFPTDFVAKRYDRRESPFLVASFAEIRQHLREIAIEWGDPA